MAKKPQTPARQSNASSKALTPAAFRQLTTKMATDLLSDWVGHDRAGEAVGRIGAALSSAAASAKNPGDFYSCTAASIANCVAISALTGIMPGTGSASLAYLIPRSPRQGEQKQLGFSFSHRGLNALAGRSGQTMVAIPISHADSISVTTDGEVSVDSIDFDNPPTEYEELRGVVVIVKRIESGTVICRGWMPRKLIDKRRDDSDSFSFAIKPGNEWAKKSDPWHKWPVEMAIKTAMHYAVSRGWCVIDDTSSVRALANDASNTVEAVTVLPQTAPRLAPPDSLDDLTSKLEGSQVASESGATEDSKEAGDDQPFTASLDDFLADVGMAAAEELGGIYAAAEKVLADKTELRTLAAAVRDREAELSK